MTRFRIRAYDIVPDMPLAWDVMDEGGYVVLRKGDIVSASAQLPAALDGGLFVSEGSGYVPSALRIINHVNRRLDHLLHHLQQEQDAESKLFDLAGAVISAVEVNADIALSTILLNQDAADYAVRHCVDTAIVSVMVARALEKSRSETLSIAAAALTMNLGMLNQQSQLQGRQEALSSADKDQIRAHPQTGERLLRDAGVTDDDWLACVLMHHENEDGSGYPFGKSGDDIPLAAKIMSLADRYCARVSSRNYRKSVLPDEALSDILIGDNASIDPMLTACFIREFGIYPTGVFVRLANGEVAVVTGKGASKSAPRVKSLLSASNEKMVVPLERDTASPAYAIKEMLTGEQTAIRVEPGHLWGGEAAG
jgi:HD-GYP domain-containing protein (c-di-GMP phosphodiesterase class II)